MTHRAITFTDNPDDLYLKLKKVRDSAKKVDLTHKKLKIFLKKHSENSQFSLNTSKPIESNCNIIQNNLKSDSKKVDSHFVKSCWRVG